MGRIRTIKPEILEDEVAGELSHVAWRFWVSMWVIADDHGNLRARPRYLANVVFAYMDAKPDVGPLLDELERARVITRYTVRGQAYLGITNWKTHQRISNAGRPHVPGREEADSASAASRRESPRVAASRRDSRLDLRPTTNDQRPTTTTESISAAFPSETFSLAADPTQIVIPAPTDEAVKTLWNEICAPAGLGEVREINQERRGKIRKMRSRLKSINDWRGYFARIASGRAACGENDRGWRLKFDKAISTPNHVAKVFEGHYDEPWTGSRPKTDAQRAADEARALENLE